MNRRMMAGLLGLALALVGSSQTALGMQMRDPSSAGTVGFTPLDSIGEKINGNSVDPQTTTTPPGVPTDPTTTGPLARVPKPPVGPNPVGMTTQPSLSEPVYLGPPTAGGGFGWFFRRPRTSAATSKANRGGPASMKVDPAAIPSRMTWDDSGDPNPMKVGTGTVSGRPSPYANQSPELPRRQANAPALDDSDGTAVLGRPAPLRSDVPRQGRPKLIQSGEPAASKPRPRNPVGVNPRVLPPSRPAPPIPSTLPTSDPSEPTTPVEPAARSSPPLDPAVGSAPAAESTAPPTLPAIDAAPNPLPEMPEPPPSLPTGPTVDVRPPPEAMPAEALKPETTPPVTANPTVAEPIAPSPVQATSNPAKPTDASTSTGATPVDPEIKRTSGDPTAIRIEKEREKDRPFASARAAAVGDEVITVHQVEALAVEKYKTMTAGQQVSDAEKREILNTLGAMALEHLIEQSLVLQEAKRKMKSPKMKQNFDEFVNKRWHDEKLPGLLQKTATTNEYELKRKLAEQGQSYAEMQDSYHNEMLEHDFLFNEIKNKVNLDLIQLRAYYNENLKSYDQPARISWREVEVSVAKYPDRAAARKRADAILARLRRKEDFAAVAQSSSDGPTASKGGLYADMTPGGYGIPSVNDTLNVIAEGEISPVLEAPMSFHIIRVESRRAAGPLPFDEVQRQVAEEVFKTRMEQAREQYIAKLRAKTLVRVMPMFERPKGDPNGRADANLMPASNR